MDIREKGNLVYQITVVGVKKKPIVIDIATSEPSFQNMTIGELKIILEDKLPGGVLAIRLTFADVQLEDPDTFHKMKIKPNSTLSAIVRLPGGGGSDF